MYIFKYILKRIALMLFVFFVIVTMCFVLVKLLPNVPAEAFGKDMELILKRRELLGYDLPILQQYGRFLKYAVQGNFGYGETYKMGSPPHHHSQSSDAVDQTHRKSIWTDAHY